MKLRTNPAFDKQVADIALSRGISRASTLCALLLASGQANTRKIPRHKYERCFFQLLTIDKDLRKSEAFGVLCDCAIKTKYDVEFEDEREKHSDDCLYVIWRDLIGDPLESILDEEACLKF